MPKDFTLIFSHQKQLSPDVHSFYFNREGSDFNFLAGQHIKLFLPVSDPEGSNRSFSICSSPLEDEIMITTKISATPFKQALISLDKGTRVKTFGPVGRMIVTEEEKESILMLAGGIGITPFRSMLLFTAQKQLSIPITFFVSFSTTEEMLFYNELSKVPTQNSNIKVVYTITKDERDWRGERGRISKEMIEKYVQDFQKAKAYIAGPPGMVTAMLEIVQELGLPPEKILKENFVGY